MTVIPERVEIREITGGPVRCTCGHFLFDASTIQIQRLTFNDPTTSWTQRHPCRRCGGQVYVQISG